MSKLWEAMVSSNIGVARVAAETGVTESAVRSWIRGEHGITPIHRVAFDRLFGPMVSSEIVRAQPPGRSGRPTVSSQDRIAIRRVVRLLEALMVKP